MRVLVAGAGGQLGAAVVQECAGAHDVVGLPHASLDLLDAAAVAAAVKGARPDAIVNAAAYNFVDQAEARPAEAIQVNAIAVRTLARAARASGAALVHYSTDFVFDGGAREPYRETDTPNPRSVYAWSKLLGEWFAADAPGAYILRVESLFGAGPGATAKGSVESIVRALREGADIPVFTDRTVSPTFVMDAAQATRSILERQPPSGIYHCVNSGRCTWWEFAQEAARLMRVTSRLRPVRMSDVPLPASRPAYCALSNAKLASVGIRMPPWQDALARYVTR
jgi:dTDP-4-dehydrorhamnose reductase